MENADFVGMTITPCLGDYPCGCCRLGRYLLLGLTETVLPQRREPMLLLMDAFRCGKLAIS